VPTLVLAGLEDSDSFPQRVAEAASPIDDVRGTALYRRHALHILARRALDRCLA
jgi:CO/xanthine dehydrogenase FAD-binding subunit